MNDEYVKMLTARQVIEMIANEWVELSHEKVLLQRNDHIKWCKQWLEVNQEHTAWLLIDANTGAMKVSLETPSRDDKITHRVIPLFIDDERTFKWLGVISNMGRPSPMEEVRSWWAARKENAE
jgi:hypothetical protein